MANAFFVFLISIAEFVWNLVRLDGTTRGGSVELWVVLTTVLLLANFAVDSYGSRIFPRWFMKGTRDFFAILNSSCVPYTIGLMEPSLRQGGGPLSNFFQVWAVLIVTMQHSVSVSRPAKGKDLTLVDLVSSLWSGSLLRRSTNTALRIMLPLWLIWSLNALRIVRSYQDSVRAADATVDSMKLVSDYMASSGHTTPDACPDTMVGYKYLVHGEEEHAAELLRPNGATTLVMAPKDLITLETVWSHRESDDEFLGKDSDDKYKDVCLSFALYKLLRRRFFDFPIPEASNRRTRKLVFDGILKETDDYERAFRVTEVELSFLRDFSYSKHPVVFSSGFPVVRLLLSVLMIVSLLYTVYVIRDIPSAGTYATADEQLARVTHGVAVTRCIIAIIACRELWEIRIYGRSQWTKVLVISHYVRLLPRRGWISTLQRLMMGRAARVMFRKVGRGRWNQKMKQYNLISASVPFFCGDTDKIKLQLHVEVKEVLFESLKALNPHNGSLGHYLRRAFPDDDARSRIERLVGDLKGETHKVLVWHVATTLCQIRMTERAGMSRMIGDPDDEADPEYPPLYVTAVSLSNYCAHLVSQALLPDNGLVAKKVFAAVRREARDDLFHLDTVGKVYNKLVAAAWAPDRTRDEPSILKIGAQLSVEIRSTYRKRKALWAHLGEFWAGYLLHLSANTRAAKHKVHLQGGGGELTTHLWALLSHAGFLGDINHGHQMLDPEDLGDA